MSRFPAVGGEGGAQPIMLEDKAETFAESDVTTGANKTEIDSESVRLSFERQTETTQTTSSYTQPGESGIRFVPNETLNGVYAETPNIADADGATAELRDGSGNVLDTVENTSSATEVLLEGILSAGVEYELVAIYAGDHGYTTTAGFPIQTTECDIVGGTANGSDTTDWFSWEAFQPAKKYQSGSMTVEWPKPADVFRWDAATFQTSPDGETVDVYIEESTDSGATWTEIAGPISRGQDITAAPDSEVRFRVGLSVANTANNPTLDSIYRRWVV